MNTRNITLFFLFFFTNQLLHAQCSITVDAGLDQTLCAPGGNVNLNGSVTGSNVIATTWSPNSVANPNSLNTTASVSTPTTFTLTAQVVDSSNDLITNGNFDAGISDFTSDYIEGTGGTFGTLSNEGQYATTTNASLVHNNFAPCTDHTGGGQMLVVNGATAANANIWCQDVSISPMTNYVFSFWAQTVVPANPGILQFSINGFLQGVPFNLPTGTCQWQQFSASWFSGNNTTATLCITNQNTAGSGNDFAIDDIVFSEVCEQTDEIFVDVITLDAAIPFPPFFPCILPPGGFTLYGTNSSSGPNITYQWTTTNGNILSGDNTQTIMIDAVGTYTFDVIYDDGTITCSHQESVTVSPDPDVPDAIPDVIDEIDCNQTPVTILGGSSSQGGNFTYQWTTNDGNITSDPTGFDITVDAAGTYTIVVTNNDNGCTAESDVTVSENINIPDAVANTFGDLNCQNTTVDLDGLGSSIGNFDYQWSTPDGNILNGENTLNPTVNMAGTYTILVTNNDNGCTNSADVTVIGNSDLPDAVAASPSDLDCQNTTVDLDGLGSSIGNFDYQWSTPDGNILNGENTLNPTVNIAGTYTILVTNNDNGCTNSADVTVIGNSDFPDAVAASPSDLDCQNTTVDLDGLGSSIGNFDYQWSTPDGNILNGENTLNPTVNMAGTYTILVTNNDNGCTNSADVTVIGNSDLPDAVAASPSDLDCQNTTVDLDGLGSSIGNFDYQWSTPDGNILNGENTLNPTVNMAGTYTILVTNNDNGCTNSADVTVIGNSDFPDAVAASPSDLDCQNTTVDLDGLGSSIGNFDYQWSTPDGNILNGENTLNPTVNIAGTYTILVTNNDNGCTNSADVTVIGNSDLPDAAAAADDDLTCQNTQISLNGNGSATNNSVYLWTTPNGNILDGNTTLSPTVDASGTYILVVTDNQTGCTNSAEVIVEGSTDMPMAEIEMPEEINCNNDPVLLDAGNSSSVGNFTYQWSTPDGNFSNLSDLMMVEVDLIGTYILTITNEDNGCTATTSATVTLNDDSADVEIAMPDSVDCSGNEVMISANNLTVASGFNYQWSTTNGNLTGGTQSLTPTVDAQGTYTLTVTNQDTGCTADFSVEVEQNSDVPMVEFSAVDSLTCLTNSLIINAENSSSGSNYSFNWTTADGNFLNNQNTLQPEINAAGTYILTIIDNSNNCETSQPITIDENMTPPIVEAGSPFVLNCNNPTSNLDLMGSNTGANFNILWETMNGNILSDPTSPTPNIDAPGVYNLTITNMETGCTATDFVEITDDFAMPTADAGMPTEITCTAAILNLNGQNSSQGNDFTYEWTTANGNISTGETSLNPEINAAGDYQLIVTNTANGCTAMSMVEVTENVDFPEVDAGQMAELTCTLNEITLTGDGSQGNNFTYQWTTADGNIVQDENTLTPTINEAGMYQLVVTNTQNDCSATANVTITEDITPPDAEAGNPFELSCSVTEANLSGSTTGANFTYEWTTTNGNILADATTLTPTINAPGMYELVVTNPTNGCIATDQIQITQDANAPTADAGTAAPITCLINTIELDASNSSNSGTITYQWTTAEGNILNGQNSLNPQVDAPGTYILTVSDSANDCETISSVMVEENTALPTAEAGDDDELTCVEMMLNLNAETSSQGNDFTYEWTTQNGNILNGENTLNPQIDEAGIYQILITNTATGCTNTDETQIIENQTLPTISNEAPDEINCFNSTILINGNGTSTGSEFSYEWTTQNGDILNGENTLNPEVTSEGIYTLLVTNTNNGCTAENDVQVMENTTPPTAEAGQNQMLTCEILSINLDGNGTSVGADFNYEWTTQNGSIANGQNTLNPDVSAAGIYQILVTNMVNGCTAIDEVEVEQNVEMPNISIANPDDLTCIETLVNLDASDSDNGTNFNYEWTTTNGNITAGATTLTPEVDETGNYILTITNTENGCTETATITVNEDILLPTVDAGAAQVLNCNLQSTALSGSGTGLGNLTFAWETANGNINAGNNTATPTINQPGLYSLTVTDELNGCTNTDEVEITEIFLNDFDFETANANCAIPTGSLNFGAVDGGQAPYLYSIDGGENFAQNTAFLSLQPTNYQLVIQDANGCELEANAFISEAENIELALDPQVILRLGDTYQVNVQTSIPSSTIAEVIWSPAIGLSCTDCLNPVASPTVSTTYTVHVIDENGCTASAKIVLLINKDVDVFFPNVFSPNGDGSNERFYPFAEDNTVANISNFQIFDRWGERVYELYDFLPNDANFGWNGVYRGKAMNPAVFVFVSEVEFLDGRTEVFRGDFTLIR